MDRISNRQRIGDFSALRGLKWNMSQTKYGAKIDNIITFDIETSTGYIRNNKYVADYGIYNKIRDEWIKTYDGSADVKTAAIMYIWQAAIDVGDDIYTFYGRTWDEYKTFVAEVSEAAKRYHFYGRPNGGEIPKGQGLKKLAATIWIHNLPYEFQFLRNLYNDQFARKDAVFARNAHKPMKARASAHGMSVMYKDTYVLTQKSLANWGKDEHLNVQKAVGDLNYNQIMTPITPITETELGYCERDVVTMVYGLRKYVEKYGSLDDIPMTQTGAVRRICEAHAAADLGWQNICREISEGYTYRDLRELEQVYWGGWTHANSRYVGIKLKNIQCFDFTSSYPAVMCRKKFPISAFASLDVKEFPAYETSENHRYYLCATLRNVCSNLNNTFIPAYKMLDKDADGNRIDYSNAIVDNGKLYQAPLVRIACIDLDWLTIKEAYAFESYEIEWVKVADADYLPKCLVEVILDYFQHKCSLKGDDDALSLYNESKQFINSIYGVAVTKVLTDTVVFTGDANTRGGWSTIKLTESDYDDADKERKQKIYYLTYAIGVWVAGWARYNLWRIISALDAHVVYGDTDSAKGMFTDEDLKIINQFNDNVYAENKKAADAIGVDVAKYTGKGDKVLGRFADDGYYYEFKTLGAKRYCANEKTKSGAEIKVTVAGLPKSAGSKIKSVDDFKDGVVWRTDESHKLTLRYFDDQTATTWIDRDGNEYVSHDRYGIAMTGTEYRLERDDGFKLFCDGIQRTEMEYMDNEDKYAIIF